MTGPIQTSGLQASLRSALRLPGLRLDLAIFLLNLGAMATLAGLFSDAAKRAATGDGPAQILIISVTASLLVLAPVGATLKRWHVYQQPGMDKDIEIGCLFNPVFYFCLLAVVFSAVNAYAIQSIFGTREGPEGVFVGSVLGGFVFMVIHTILVYRYFFRPTKPPRLAFLQSPLSAKIGNACLVANAIVYQLFWNLLATINVHKPSGFEEFAGRLFLLLFLAMLIYFPPRMFFLVHERGNRWAWVMMLVANLPLILRLLVGFGYDPGGFE